MRNTILYAEDGDAIREYTEWKLRARFPDYIVESHTNGKKLSDRLEKNAGDIAVVITDGTMIEDTPEGLVNISGVDIIRNFAGKHKEIPFILYYGGDEITGKMAERFGAFGYVIKEESSLDKLLEMTEKALTRK